MKTFVAIIALCALVITSNAAPQYLQSGGAQSGSNSQSESQSTNQGENKIIIRKIYWRFV